MVFIVLCVCFEWVSWFVQGRFSILSESLSCVSLSRERADLCQLCCTHYTVLLDVNSMINWF